MPPRRTTSASAAGTGVPRHWRSAYVGLPGPANAQRGPAEQRQRALSLDLRGVVARRPGGHLDRAADALREVRESCARPARRRSSGTRTGCRASPPGRRRRLRRPRGAPAPSSARSHRSPSRPAGSRGAPPSAPRGQREQVGGQPVGLLGVQVVVRRRRTARWPSRAAATAARSRRRPGRRRSVGDRDGGQQHRHRDPREQRAGSPSHSEWTISRWCSRASRATAPPSASSMRLAERGLDRPPAGQSAKPLAEPVAELGQGHARRHLRGAARPSTARTSGSAGRARSSRRRRARRRRPRRARRPVSARRCRPRTGRRPRARASPVKPSCSHSAARSAAHCAGRVAVGDLLRPAVPALVDGDDLVAGRGEPAAPTPSQSRALDDSPCTSRNGRPGRRRRGAGPAAARRAAGPSSSYRGSVIVQRP